MREETSRKKKEGDVALDSLGGKEAYRASFDAVRHKVRKGRRQRRLILWLPVWKRGETDRRQIDRRKMRKTRKKSNSGTAPIRLAKCTILLPLGKW